LTGKANKHIYINCPWRTISGFIFAHLYFQKWRLWSLETK